MIKKDAPRIQNMDLDRIFVCNLKKWRKNMGLSQQKLAERCNAAHSYIRQLESGSGKPSFAFIGKLADALGIDAYQLFYDETAEREKSMREDYEELLKSGFLEKMTAALDTVIKGLRK